ncbi:ribosome biogenesis GTP-binding protein YihA/YsxC [Mycoplasmoides pirum]|uniref:ribosome biogenesis GTP-binding protein YihA/YsxC n=1 Tax=Mycoplasmoides pirum TaxID=2122 RepID=UPI000486CEE4|nr:ribosome biogenesis GTP-binding protein YihA/YsxC [Mycoplasmoides pirum]
MKNYFIKSAIQLSQCPQDNTSEGCFIGRSNVGKSTLINTIAKSKIAKTSKRPGMTQTLNFYNINDKRLVDLPGYGYAKLDRNKKIELTDLISDYIQNRKNLTTIFQIIDASVITEYDQWVSKFIRNNTNLKYYVVVNKIDKLNQSQSHNLKIKIADYLKIDSDNLITISALKQKNISELIKIIKNI